MTCRSGAGGIDIKGASVAFRQLITIMVQSSEIKTYVEGELAGTPYFLVGIDSAGADGYAVVIDSAAPVDIDFCAGLTRSIRDHFGSELDDYNLEVGSAGLTSAFRVRGQWIKHLGKEIEVLTNEGRKLQGPLSAVDALTFTIDVSEKRRVEGMKRPMEVTEQVVIPFSDVRTARALLKF